MRLSIDLRVHRIIPYREVDQTNDEETKGWFHSHVTKFSLRSSHSYSFLPDCMYHSHHVVLL